MASYGKVSREKIVGLPLTTPGLYLREHQRRQ